MSGDRNKGHFDICAEVTEKEKVECQICKKLFKSKAGLAGHVGAFHNFSMEKYVEMYFFKANRPVCPICGQKTSYVKGKYGFKRFCFDHAGEGRKSWSKQYGFDGIESKTIDAGWKKGLTKETNESILKYSISISGKKNASALTEEKFNEYKQKFIEENKLELLTPFDEYFSRLQTVKVKCLLCGKEQENNLMTLHKGSSCKYCFSGKSKEEYELYEFISSVAEEYNIIRGDRTILRPKELDIYIPEKKIAIEYNGLFWHNEVTKSKRYHQDKYLGCLEKGISLFQIYSDEWRNKQKIIKSMIKYKLGKVETKIDARKCKVVELFRNNQYKNFFENNHISGYSVSKMAFGLVYKDELVSCLSLRGPFHTKYKGKIEICRFANKLNVVVRGGFSRLLKAVILWSKNNGYSGILSYADLNYGDGKVYLKSGFTLFGYTNPSYGYTDGKDRFNRFIFRSILGKTEKQIAEEANVQKIYGCGSNIYIMDFLH
ncbi:hypothetical protein M0R19_04210 [Candidatus Pacearchaeota archaeon]|nr:hypothetical protein [Candidatus Pacearchaeota archaeon]